MDSGVRREEGKGSTVGVGRWSGGGRGNRCWEMDGGAEGGEV